VAEETLMAHYDADEHCKAVYAHFGLAIYLAQCLEHGLAIALVYLNLIPGHAGSGKDRDEWSTTCDAFMGRRFQEPLGPMIEGVRRVTKVPPDLEVVLADALRKRNWLVHHYFRERATDFMNAAGRDRMIRELEEAQTLSSSADRALDRMLKPVREKYGITDVQLHEAFESLRKETDGEV
jgi:hypothetical protein